MRRFLIGFIVSLLTLGFVACGEKNTPLQNKINDKLSQTADINNPIKTRVTKIDIKHRVARVELEFDVSRISDVLYFNELARVESILLAEGFHELDPVIIHKPMGYRDSRRQFSLEYKDKKVRKVSAIGFSDLDKNWNYNSPLENKKEKRQWNAPGILKSKRAVINYPFVKLREKPGTRNKVVTYLFDGCVVKVRKKTRHKQAIAGKLKHWYQVETRDRKRGWVYGQYLSPTETKIISSSLKNNKIYKDFMKKKNILLPGKYHRKLSRKGQNFKIDHNKMTVSVGKQKTFNIPFKVKKEKVHWQASKIALNDMMDNDPYFDRKHKLPKREKWISKKDRDIIKEYSKGYSNLHRKEQRKISRMPRPMGISPDTEETKPVEKWEGRNFEKPFDYNPNKSHSHRHHEVRSYIPRKKEPVIVKAPRHRPNNYNLKVLIGDFVPRTLNEPELRRAEAIMKLVEAKLVGQDYYSPKRFHMKHNILLETVEIKLKLINFEEKLASVGITRLKSNDKGTGTEIVATDRWDFRFTELYNTRVDYEKFGDIYYSEVLLYLSRAGSKNKAEILGLSNYIVERLLFQKYI
ncbi:MAG: SH3 domain-containing protein [Spirochaetota bacterium]|nr:SH3 domain-containing protein [Spirochaetota bacterium]